MLISKICLAFTFQQNFRIYNRVSQYALTIEAILRIIAIETYTTYTTLNYLPRLVSLTSQRVKYKIKLKKKCIQINNK